MGKYLIKKITQLSIVMILISFFSFAVIYFAPGDISSMYITPEMTQEQKDNIREELGVDKSLSEQYLSWASKAVRGDMGVSLSNKMPVTPQFKKRLPSTLYLMGSSMILSLVIAIPLGLIAGYKENKSADLAISIFSYSGMSIPSFWFGMVLIIIFSARLKWLPSSGMTTVGVDTFSNKLKHLLLPCITLSIGSVASYIRYIRSSTIQQLSKEYVTAAKAKGTSGWKLLRRHILKNTLLPIITMLGMNFAGLVTGSFIIESIFGWPGIGTLAMTAIGQRDYPMIMAYIMLSGTMLVLGNFIAEILYAIIDPRIQQKG